jgi:hypothetical protein
MTAISGQSMGIIPQEITFEVLAVALSAASDRLIELGSVRVMGFAKRIGCQETRLQQQKHD